ncbi:MAG TPA: DUF4421 family protein [Cyclobacteriaceae bacterium]|nr:DUF4421 family protein [Cyclobacteriaceae bacterium]
MRFGPLILALSCSVTVLGQTTDSTRSRYIQAYSDYFFIWPLLKARSSQFDIRRSDNRSQVLTYRPNNSYGAGVGVYVFELALEATLSVPVDEKRVSLYGESKEFDVQINALSKHWVGDVFYQKYSGFYRDDSSLPVPANQPHPLRPDVVTEALGINGVYFFNRHRFSYRSAYNFAERQKHSAGSFLLAGSINRYELRADSSIYGPSYYSIYGNTAAINQLRSMSISLAPGYSYTLVVGRWFVNAALSVGPAFTHLSYKVNNANGSIQRLNTYADVRFGLGYNGDRFFTGLTWVSQTRAVTIDEMRLTTNSLTLRILAGYRFREFGILKKRAFDLLPFGKH